jgi:hypothetical protein
MTIKEFLQDNTLTAVETVDNLIINLVCGEALYGIDVDTSNIPSGTLTTRRTDYTLIDNILSVDTISVNTETTNMLGE